MESGRITLAEESNPALPGEPSATAPPMPTIHEAELASGASGAAIRGTEIDMGTAVARGQRGENVVVCGDDLKANRRLAASTDRQCRTWL
jgi:hypothetical protein